MKTLHKFLTLAVAVGLMATACDSSLSIDDQTEILDEETAAFEKELVEDLNLEDDQEEAVGQVMRQFANRQRQPGFLWNVADVLSDTLTDEQKAVLFAHLDTARARHAVQVLIGPIPGFGKQGRFAGQERAWPPVLDTLLTEEQKAAMIATAREFGSQFNVLMQAFENEEIEPAAFIDAAFAMKNEYRSAVAEILTEEQVALLEAFQLERREARAQRFEERQSERLEFLTSVKEVRDEVLGLDAATSAELDAIREAAREAMRAVVAGFKDGNYNAETALAYMREAHDDAEADVIALVGPEAYEVIQIHEALAMRHKKGKKNQKGPRGNGPQGGGPFGNNAPPRPGQ